MRSLEEENMHINMKKYQKITLKTAGIVGFSILCLAIFQSFEPADSTAENIDVSLEKQIEQRTATSSKIHSPLVPTDVNFCGEKLDFTDPEVFERFDRELIVNSFLHGSTILYLKKSSRYFPMIEKILKSEGVPDDMKYLCVAESGLAHAISPAGASGFWQFMKSTAIMYKLQVNDEIDERYDIEKATYAACQLLKDSKAKFGTWSMAAAAYNAGSNGMAMQVELQQQDSYFDLHLNNETSRYVFRIIALKYIMQNPEKYGFFVAQNERYEPFTYKTVTIQTTPINWVEVAESQGISYKTLRYHNAKIRKPVYSNRGNEKIIINIPQKD